MWKNRVFVWLMLFLFFVAALLYGKKKQSERELDELQAWERMVEVTGKVNSTNHPELGLTPVPGVVIAFRRTDDAHIVAVHTDSDGYYEVFLEPGSYKIILINVNADRSKNVEVFVKNREKYLTVGKNLSRIHFDIETTLPDYGTLDLHISKDLDRYNFF
jgi:hypothetical protein